MPTLELFFAPDVNVSSVPSMKIAMFLGMTPLCHQAPGRSRLGNRTWFGAPPHPDPRPSRCPRRARRRSHRHAHQPPPGAGLRLGQREPDARRLAGGGTGDRLAREREELLAARGDGGLPLDAPRRPSRARRRRETPPPRRGGGGAPGGARRAPPCARCTATFAANATTAVDLPSTW